MLENAPKSQSSSMPTPLRVLLVEDGLVNQRMAAGLLKRAGHDVTLAENGEVAIRYWEQQGFDLILMDVQMPVMNGLEAATNIREQEANSSSRIPIIAMTATAEDEDKGRCLAAGMDDYLAKPLVAETLFASIAKCINGTPVSAAVELSETDSSSDEIVDFDAAFQKLPGGVELHRELAGVFLTECPKLLKELRQGLADDDAHTARRAVHTLKGAARILIAHQVMKLSGELEQLSKENQLDAVRSRLDEIASAVERACDVTKAWLE
jgi:CheY-like chemotaxis protein